MSTEEDKNYSINKMVTEERMRQIPQFADEEKDSTKVQLLFGNTILKIYF